MDMEKHSNNSPTRYRMLNIGNITCYILSYEVKNIVKHILYLLNVSILSSDRTLMSTVDLIICVSNF